MADKINITISDITGSRQASVTLKTNLTGDDVIKRLIENKFLAQAESGKTYNLSVKGKDVIIQPNQTLESAGVQDGDVLIAGTITRGG